MAGEDRSVYRVVSAEIQREGRYLITQRAKIAVLPLLWEFPGGRVRAGEDDTEVLRRNLKRRLGVEAEVGEMVMEVTHEYDGYDLVMGVYRCALTGAEPSCVTVENLAWVLPEEFAEYPFPGADQKTVDALLGGE